ncbi:MFS transporter [Paralimibaculum aggregatum]|uniref:MFS transporter n=1 Tax=Paralimibaculum aggregatum TaxID=3036245 RepID=A0ABQ6LKR2_9RHOB|nr:MFS transporter [Limibaculum sp. NKW23]GMG81823.1 MFS transporter [Limibaculum sp. NKW23]
MWRACISNWPLFLGTLLIMLSNGLLVTLLSIRGTTLGFSETAIGLMQACYPLGALAGAALVPRLVIHVGHVRAFGTLASLCSTAAVVHLVTADPWSWGAMRALAGFCFPGLYIVAESWLNAAAENRSRGALLSIYVVTQTLGGAIGQAMVGIPDPSGALLFGLVSILISLALVPVLAVASPVPRFEVPERMGLGALYRISPMAVTGAMLNGVAQGAFYVAVPLFALARGYGVAEAGLLLTTATLASAAVQVPAGWLSDRTDRRRVLAGLAGGGALLAALIAAGLAESWLALAVAGVAALTFPIYSLAIAHANDQLTPGQFVPASGTLVMAMSLGTFLGAGGGPLVIGAFGPWALFALLALTQAATAATALARIASRAAPEQLAAARALSPQAQQVAARLDPRGLAGGAGDGPSKGPAR